MYLIYCREQQQSNEGGGNNKWNFKKIELLRRGYNLVISLSQIKGRRMD